MKVFPLILALGIASCGSGSGNNSATSTSIDSTKMNGTAPVQYGNDNPADDTIANTGTGESTIQGNDGMSNRRTQSGVADGPVGNQQGGTSPRAAGTGQNVSNTTDASTTDGSAQGSSMGTGTRR